jgi:K+-sensing histidine kinase KdpD
MRRSLIGTTAALASMAALTAAMIPLRAHLSIATVALILVVPVVIGVITGGFIAGVISVGAGFLVYDFFFIPRNGQVIRTNGVVSDQTEGHGPGIHTGAMHGEKRQAHQVRAELFELVNS